MPPVDGQGEGGNEGTGGQEGGQQGQEGGQQQQAPEGGQQQPQEGAFLDSVQDPTLKDWAAAKGWKSPEAVLKSAHNLEKMVGAPADQVVRIPPDADAETLKGVFTKLGMPESPDGYEIPVAEGFPVDEDFQGFIKGAFHKANLTAAQAKTVAEQYNEYVQDRMERDGESYKAQVTSERQDLQSEWGNGFERKMNTAKLAAKTLGFDEDLLTAVESQVGYAKTYKFLADIGAKLGEDTFVDGEQKRDGFSSTMTPVEARSAWASMTSDPEKMKALRDNQHPAHKEVLEQKRRLFEIMHPDQ